MRAAEVGIETARLFMPRRSPKIGLRDGVRQMKRTVVPTRIVRAWFEQPHSSS